MDCLARTLIGLSGCAVTNAQAKDIKRLYEDHFPYDKKPRLFESRLCKPNHSCFARSKIGHVVVEQMKKVIQLL